MLVDDDNATGCSGASASTGTLVTTNHLLLITFLAVWKEISNMHTKGKKRLGALMFGSFDGSRTSSYVAEKNHISFQQTCSVQKSSTVALPVVFRSSEKKITTFSQCRNLMVVASSSCQTIAKLTGPSRAVTMLRLQRMGHLLGHAAA